MAQPTQQQSRFYQAVSILAFFIVFAVNSASAEEKLNLKYTKTIESVEFSKDLKVRGIKLSDGMYLGQAKVAGKYGFGIVVDKKRYSWGINHRGISISKAF